MNEIEKWFKVHNNAKSLLEFSDWLSQKGYFLAHNVDYGVDEGACTGIYGERKINNVPEKWDALIYQFFEIDHNRLDDERDIVVRTAQLFSNDGAIIKQIQTAMEENRNSQTMYFILTGKRADKLVVELQGGSTLKIDRLPTYENQPSLIYSPNLDMNPEKDAPILFKKLLDTRLKQFESGNFVKWDDKTE